MSKLELILLGRFECLLSSGTRVTLSMRKAEILLAFLALAPGLRHPRERLINLLWSDRGEEQARNSLRQCLSGIRKSLGEAADLVLHVDRTSVSLNAELIDVDAHEFERLAELGDYESLQTAADLYQGEFLEGIVVRDAASQEWLDSERARFKRQFVEILYNLAETQLVSHDYGHAIKSAERLVEQDPLGESGWRLLMQAQAASGNRNHALQAFKRCQQTLRRELDVVPETATTELRDRIAAGETGHSAPSPAPPMPDAQRRSETSGSERRIAVLPFDNLSGDPAQEYFSDGITESIILNLALFPDLHVKSRNSSFAFKQQLKGLAEISRELDVDYLVEGSIRKSKDRIRITVQLIEVASGNQVWGKRYDSDLADLFELEEELSRSIAATVTGRIESELQRVALAKGAAGQESYDLLLGGTHHAHLFTRRDTAIAIDKLNQCLQRDPENIRAHKQLYSCHLMNYLERWSEDHRASFELAAEHIGKAMALAPGSDTVQIFYAQYLVFRGKFEEADRYLQKALKSNPNNPDALTTLALCLEIQGKAKPALEAAEHSCRLDPYHPWAEWEVAVSLFVAGKLEAVSETIARMRTSPGFVRIFDIAAKVRLGQTGEAGRELRDFLQDCRENMLAMPRTRSEWLQYTRENYPFADPRINEEIVDDLVRAGLEEHLEPSESSARAPAAEPSVAVLPFDNLSGDPAQEYFSDGITESIILNLALFPGLHVKSRSASFAFKQQLKGLAEISRKLEVDYLVEGSIRKSKERIRIMAQLIDAASGNQVWGKRYDAELDDIFDLEAELSRTIAATVTGRIESDLQRIAIARGASNQDAYELLLDGIYHSEKVTRQDTAIAIEKLNRCIELDPDNARAHVALYTCHWLNFAERWVRDPHQSFELCKRHSLKAMEIAPDNAVALAYYGEYLVFAREPEKAIFNFDKALQRNPNSIDALTGKAFACSMMGDNERAQELAKLSHRLDPYHPWVWWNLTESYVLTGQYQAALETITTAINEPSLLKAYAVVAHVKLGQVDQASKVLAELIDACRDSMISLPASRDEWFEFLNSYIPYKDDSFSEMITDCFVEAGLESHLSAELPADTDARYPTILVLPFANLSGDPEQEYFSDGITESVILNLGSFRDIRVKSRHTSFAFKESARSVNDIATELGVDYVVEGSIRKSADRILVTVQLAQAVDGNQLWGRRFDVELENLFDLERELSLTIAGTVSGRIEKNSRRSALQKPAGDLRAYDYFMRGRYHIEHFTAQDIGTAIDQLEQCLALDPDYAPAHALLGMAHLLQRYDNICADREQAMEIARRHLERALEIDPEDATIRAYLAEYFLNRKDFDLAMTHARKSAEINPTLADGYLMLAWHAGCTRRYDEALEYADLSLQVDQFHPYAGWNAGEVYRTSGDYQRAIDTFRSIPHLSPSVRAQIAACYAGLGRLDEAHVEMRQFLDLARRQMSSMPSSREKWYRFWDETMPYEHREDTDRFFDLLLQAGLCDELEGDATKIPSIAVLPFDNMSGDPEQEHFADGITTDIIATLFKFRHLRTVSRYSTLQYKTDKPPIADIAAQQGVRYVLEGSVRKSGERIRVSAELIDSANGQILWNDRYDRDLDDLFAVQDEITRNIALAMKVQFDDGEMARHRSSGASDIRAWELTLIAVDLQDTYVYRKIMESRGLAQKAIRLDPGYAFAWVVLAWTHFQETYAGWCESFEESIAAADEANRKALEIDPDYGEAWSQAGTIAIMKQESDTALEACRRAVEIEPGNAEIQTLMAMALQFAGAYDEARKHCREVTRLCPVQPNWYYLFPGHIEMQTGNPQQAIAIYRQGVEVEPESPLCRFYLVDALLRQGNEAGARACADEIRALDDTVKGRGLVRSYSSDEKLRQQLRASLEKFGLY